MMVRPNSPTETRRSLGRRAAACLVLTTGLAGCPGLAEAECLYDAFRQASTTNPTLAAQSAAVRVSVQDKVLAATGYAPSLSTSSDWGDRNQKGTAPGNPTSDLTSHPRGYGATVSQNIWNGFKTTNSVARESASLDAARDTFRDAEQKILVDVTTAYMDVLRDAAILALRQGNAEVLADRANQTRFLLRIGQVTRTDVDQSEASLAKSQADIALARSSLESSRAVYRSIVGSDPGKLEPAAVPQRLLPRDLDMALASAQANHPAIRSAINAVRAADINIDVQKAGYAPSLDLTASADRRWDPDFYPAKTDLTDLSVMARLTFPIYDRGITTASVHRANDLSSRRMAELDGQRAGIRASVVQSWGLFAASKTVIISSDAQIAADDRAMLGVRLEATAGQRTTLDILTAQQTLLNARVNREIAEHDRVIAGYRLLAAVGRLSVESLTPADTRGKDTSPRIKFKPLPMGLEPAEVPLLRRGL